MFYTIILNTYEQVNMLLLNKLVDIFLCATDLYLSSKRQCALAQETAGSRNYFE